MIDSTTKSIIYAFGIITFFIYALGLLDNMREGLANPEHTKFVSKGIENDIESLKDSLHIEKYSSNYQAIIKDLMQWCDLEILKVIATNKININDGVNTENTELIGSLNQWSNLKNTLQSVNDNVLTNSSS